MTHNPTQTIDELWEAACCRYPALSRAEQRAAIVLLSELARGGPVTIAQFAQAIGESVATAEGFVNDSGLSPFAHASDAGLIQGFWGLSTKPTPHQFTVKSRTLWTWCAYDSLFLPELLGETAAVESRDPESGQSIRLTVSPTRIEAAEPADIVVSMISPSAWDLTSAARVMASACHFIFFFASRASAERWQSRHPQTVLLPLNDALC
jgi:alkylmercury lyase